MELQGLFAYGLALLILTVPGLPKSGFPQGQGEGGDSGRVVAVGPRLPVLLIWFKSFLVLIKCNTWVFCSPALQRPFKYQHGTGSQFSAVQTCFHAPALASSLTFTFLAAGLNVLPRVSK